MEAADTHPLFGATVLILLVWLGVARFKTISPPHMTALYYSVSPYGSYWHEIFFWSEMISQPVNLVFSWFRWSTNWLQIPQNLPVDRFKLVFFMYYFFILYKTQYKISPPLSLSLFYTEPSKPVVFNPSFEGQIVWQQVWLLYPEPRTKGQRQAIDRHTWCHSLSLAVKEGVKLHNVKHKVTTMNCLFLNWNESVLAMYMYESISKKSMLIKASIFHKRPNNTKNARLTKP